MQTPQTPAVQRAVEWAVSRAPVDYETAATAMAARVEAIAAGAAGEMVWLLEHPPVYTAGSSAQDADVLDPGRFPVIRTGRGGQVTYHGPGQRVAYVMLDLTRRGRDVRGYVRDLEQWLIQALAEFGVRGERREGRVGVWVDRTKFGGAPREDKIAAIGVRVRKWVTFHGVALNVEPDLSHYEGITPCGVADPRYGVTSLVDLGLPVGMAEADAALRTAFETIFGAGTTSAPAPLDTV